MTVLGTAVSSTGIFARSSAVTSLLGVLGGCASSKICQPRFTSVKGRGIYFFAWYSTDFCISFSDIGGKFRMETNARLDGSDMIIRLQLNLDRSYKVLKTFAVWATTSILAAESAG